MECGTDNNNYYYRLLGMTLYTENVEWNGIWSRICNGIICNSGVSITGNCHAIIIIYNIIDIIKGIKYN